jgi:multidrug resistance efflux pump
VGTKHTWAKVAAIAVCGLLAFAIFVKGNHKVEGQFVLEASEKQIVPAPFDGYLKTVDATAGDFVLTEATGAKFDALNEASPLIPLIAFPRPVTIMATLNTAELRNKLNGALADELAYNKQAQIYRREGIQKEGDAQMSEAEAAKARSQVNLFREQIASATNMAPVDGLVLKGDLKTKIGAPVKIGEELFQVGERDKIRAEVSIPEDQITDVQVAQHGELDATSFPGQHIKFTVERITPVAEVSSSHNVYKVRAVLDPADQKPWMKPGMEGIAKVHVGEESYAWIWTHRLVNWVRMKLWL